MYVIRKNNKPGNGFVQRPIILTGDVSIFSRSVMCFNRFNATISFHVTAGLDNV